MKKLAVLMMIPALAMFMAVAMASAEHNHRIAIQGTYEMVSSGSCLHSSEMYLRNPTNGRWTAPNDSKVYAGVTVSNGIWIFNHNGSGEYSQTIYATILPGGADSMPVTVGGVTTDVPVPLEVRVLASQTPVDFTYEITPSGNITVTETVSGIKLYGSISIDKKAMTLLSANNVQDFGRNLFGYTICNFARTLIKVGEIERDADDDK